MARKMTKNRICYLCGKPGADSKDHVPPKGLLPPGSNTYPRLTVPAHKSCNSNESDDEEYVRDLLIPEAIQYGLKDAEETYNKVWRAWSKPTGWARYKNFMKSSVPITTKTSSGIYTGKAIGVIPDKVKVLSVSEKIIKGILCYDAGVVISSEDISSATLTVNEAVQKREQDTHEKYWISLNSNDCYHTMFGEHIAIRRFYQGHSSKKGIIIETHIAIMLWNLFVASSMVFPLAATTKKKFKFAINTNSSEWLRNHNSH